MSAASAMALAVVAALAVYLLAALLRADRS
ncbi:K(+)-transporting ATPase subunit F [uncultured Pseudokineococcus sp.]|nr:K(+)-transporting ATPase subunit F [uncultured Pseudokineococcus sp.]